jgi:hypothetical protein
VHKIRALFLFSLKYLVKAKIPNTTIITVAKYWVLNTQAKTDCISLNFSATLNPTSPPAEYLKKVR